MKVLPFKIPKTENSSFHIQMDDERFFYDTLHQHPELQLTLIVESSGTLIHGDYLGDFNPGDVFIIGPSAPHVFRNDAVYYKKGSRLSAKALSVFFDHKTFGNGFLHLPEAHGLRQFLASAERGIRVTGALREKAGALLRHLFRLEGLERILLLLKILNTLSLSDACQFLTSHPHTRRMNEVEGKRLNAIFRFTMQTYHRPIRLEEVAEIAHMSPSAFCRYFKQHTRKTYLDFLNGFRVSQACKLLMDPNRSIAAVCYESGFNNLSNFNRKFKHHTGKTPRDFIKEKRSVMS